MKKMINKFLSRRKFINITKLSFLFLLSSCRNFSERHKVNLYGFASCLNFNSSQLKELKDYEIGYVKEGVGAGALSLLAYLKGFQYEEIVSKCEDSLLRMKKFGQISKYDKKND